MIRHAYPSWFSAAFPPCRPIRVWTLEIGCLMLDVRSSGAFSVRHPSDMRVHVECSGDFLALCYPGTPFVPFWHALWAAEGVRAVRVIHPRPPEDRDCVGPRRSRVEKSPIAESSCIFAPRATVPSSEVAILSDFACIFGELAPACCGVSLWSLNHYRSL